MFKGLFILFSSFPPFKGKLYILERYYQLFLKNSGELITPIMNKAKLALFMEDRIQRRIFIKKSHEIETEIHLLSLAKTSKCFIDIGANIGYFSILLASEFPHLEVFSFEPNPNNLKRIDINKKLNNLTNVHVNDLCISNTSGEVTFAVPSESESGWGRIDTHKLPNTEFTKVKSKSETLDNLFEQKIFGNNKPDLLKIDIEGFELNAFLGGVKFIKEYRPILCVELNEECLKENNTSSKELMDLLLSWKYSAFYISKNKLVSTKKPVENYTYLNYFFFPN